ncbi:MAG: hypothetical protein ABEJ69_00920 [Candidatus Nanohaloarchaea archaeon]
MDKTIEIILVATVVMVTALGVLFIFQGKAMSFDDFLGNQSSSAQCELLQTKYKQAGGCTTPVPTEAQNIKDRFQADNGLNCDKSGETVDAKCP